MDNGGYPALQGFAIATVLRFTPHPRLWRGPSNPGRAPGRFLIFLTQEIIKRIIINQVRYFAENAFLFVYKRNSNKGFGIHIKPIKYINRKYVFRRRY